MRDTGEAVERELLCRGGQRKRYRIGLQTPGRKFRSRLKIWISDRDVELEFTRKHRP